LLFGVQMVSIETIDDKPKIRAVVEAIGEFEFEEDIPQVESLAQFPLIGNMLALLYPFIREKIHYCLSNNQMMNVFLPPINTIDLIKDNAGNASFRLSDSRLSTQDPKTLLVDDRDS
jgi:preprotein translocase subunit SecB